MRMTNLQRLQSAADPTGGGAPQTGRPRPDCHLSDGAPRPNGCLVNRMLWIDVRSAYLELWAKERNRDPMQLADRIDREIPEQPSMPNRSAAALWIERLADVVHLTRDELLESGGSVSAPRAAGKGVCTRNVLG